MMNTNEIVKIYRQAEVLRSEYWLAMQRHRQALMDLGALELYDERKGVPEIHLRFKDFMQIPTEDIKDIGGRSSPEAEGFRFYHISYTYQGMRCITVIDSYDINMMATQKQMEREG